MLPSVVEDNASLVNDFRACLVDATCFRLALFSSCSHNYACCQCREREGAPQHCAMPINKVVKGHLWRHSHSPKGDSASVSRTHKGLKSIYMQLDILKLEMSGICFLICVFTLVPLTRLCKHSLSPFIFWCFLWLDVIASKWSIETSSVKPTLFMAFFFSFFFLEGLITVKCTQCLPSLRASSRCRDVGRFGLRCTRRNRLCCANEPNELCHLENPQRVTVHVCQCWVKICWITQWRTW